MKPAELIGKSADQLQEQVLALKKEQFNLRFQKATGQLENSSRVRHVRRDIARLLTALRLRGVSFSSTSTTAAAKPETETVLAEPKAAAARRPRKKRAVRSAARKARDPAPAKASKAKKGKPKPKRPTAKKPAARKAAPKTRAARKPAARKKTKE